MTSVGFTYESGACILRDLSLTIHRGEIVALVGRSGGGKSTLMNIVAGLRRPTEGEYLFEGQHLTGVNRSAGYVTQDDTLLPWRKTESNIALPLKMRKTPRREISERVEELMRLFQLEPARGLYPHQLSGGMRRRALLARSVIYNPSLLIMDEPFGALDVDMRADLHRELLRAIAALRQTVLFITHDVAEAIVLADRVLVLGGGPPKSIVAEEAVEFDRPRDLGAVQIDPAFYDIERRLRLALKDA